MCRINTLMFVNHFQAIAALDSKIEKLLDGYKRFCHGMLSEIVHGKVLIQKFRSIAGLVLF